MNMSFSFTAAMVGLALLSPMTMEEKPQKNKKENFRPICRIAPVPTVTCQGDSTTVQLDGSGSFDVDGDDLTYLWASCPGSSFDDPTSPTPTLTIDTSVSCDRVCGVRFEVSDGEKTSLCRVFVQVREQTGPHLDIKPGSCPNPINVSNYQANLQAKVAVSLLGNDFDVTQANVSTLRMRKVFGGGDMSAGDNAVEIFPVQDNMSDTGTPFLGTEDCGCHAEEGDGITDLDLKFFKIDMIEGFELTAEENNTFIELELVGETLDGTPFSARDCIRVINNG